MDHPSSTHASLLVRIRHPRDDEAWRRFVSIYTPLIYRYCRRQGLQDSDASDVAQEVMTAVASAIRGFEYDRQRGTFRGWLFTVTRSKLNNFFSRQQRQPRGTGASSAQQFLAEQPTPLEESQWEQDHQRRLFEWAADKVRGEFQQSTWQAFWRTAVEHEAVTEVAESLGMSAGAVYIARSRVTHRLKDYIQQMIGED